jgi:hypothetical protein
MDRVTASLVDNYIKSFGLNAENESKAFEYFCNYSIISKEYPETFDINIVSPGGGCDTGIDGLAIIVNRRLVESNDEIDDLINLNNYLEVTFIFIQSKMSSSFESNEIGTLLFGVSDFFEQEPKLTRNEFITEKARSMEHIYKQSSFMTKELPKCKIYYVTTGNWNNERDLLARIEVGKKELLQKNLFESVDFSPLGATEIQKYYRSTKEAISKEIVFPDNVTLPDIDGIQVAYTGIINYKEFKKLITDNENNILLSVFYDNVRAFQGSNPVNDQIKKTIEDGKFDQFVVLNNGVTVVAKSITSVGHRLTLRDYQIVNGCQTSHVLYEMRDKIGIDKINVPLRIIVSADEHLRNDIIISTNSQTVIKPEELEALSEFQKRLEEYYTTTKGDGQLFYERRSKQYNDDATVIKNRIITIPIQIKSFASMFLKNPHRVSRYYGSIVKTLSNQPIFSMSHKPVAYYTCAYAYYRLEHLFRTGNIDSKYKKCKFHILMLIPPLISNKKVPRFNSKDIESYCNTIIEELNDIDKSINLIERAIDIIENLGLDLNNRDLFKKQSTNDSLLAAVPAPRRKN